MVANIDMVQQATCLTNIKGDIHNAFFTGKTWVAPLKQMTIPRIELAAAVVAVRIDKMLKEELEIELLESVFWTDSTSVLKYIGNTSRRFQTYVADFKNTRPIRTITVGLCEHGPQSCRRGITWLDCRVFSQIQSMVEWSRFPTKIQDRLA